MKFLFVQLSAFPLPGVMSLSSVIKSAGWDVDLLLVKECDLFSEIRKIRPDVVGFSVFTGEHKEILRLARRIKRRFPGIFIIFGGPHPTYYPDIINEKGVDAISRGESEGAIVEFLRAYQKGKRLVGIRNIWVKKGKRVYKSTLRPLIENLDSLPFPDREIYYKYDFLKNASVKQFLTGRGCPYNCSFCSNHLLKKIYQGNGKYSRRVSPGRMVDEILDVQSRYGFETVSFTDDVLISDLGWLAAFAKIYKEKVNVPFMCNVTANSLEEKSARILKRANCYGIAMGIESGNEEIRIRILNKFVTDKQIIKSARLARKYGFILKTYNILSLPGETLADAIQTIMLNARIKPTSATASLLQPFPDYDIAKYAIKNGFLPEDFGVNDVSESIYLPSPVQSPDSRKIENLQAFFPLLVANPWLLPFIKPFLDLPLRPLFRLIARSTYGLYMSRVHKMKLSDSIQYLRHMDPLKV